MADYKLSREEQELTITISRSEDTVHLCTSDRLYMKKRDKLCNDHPDSYRKVWEDSLIAGDGLPVSVRYEFPRKLLRFGRPATEGQREHGRKRALELHMAANSADMSKVS